MGFLPDNFDSFTTSFGELDKTLDAARPFEAKIDELIRFALSIKARSAPCVRKHFRGALAAGANQQEISYVFALTMRESAGADDCWTHSVIGDLVNSAVDIAAQPAAAGDCGCS